jgi:hypothetical protein
MKIYNNHPDTIATKQALAEQRQVLDTNLSNHGVWDEAEHRKKSDIIQREITASKSLSEVFIGENLQNSKLIFPDTFPPPPNTIPYKGIVFTDGSYIGYVQEWALYDSTDTAIMIIHEGGEMLGRWRVDEWVPDKECIVASVDADVVNLLFFTLIGVDTISTQVLDLSSFPTKAELASELNLYPTKVESNTAITTLIGQTAENYYDKAAIDQIVGGLSSQNLTQEQIDQIVAAIPDADIVSANELTSAISTALTQSRQYTDTQIAAIEAEVGVAIAKVQAGLDSHKNTDRFRWQDAYDGERESMVRDAYSVGLKLNESATTTVTNNFTVPNVAGGILGVSMTNSGDTYSTVTINGLQAYSSDGLTANVPVTKYFMLREGDVVSIVNTSAITWTPLIADPETPYAQLQNEVILNKQEMLARFDELDSATISYPLNRSNPTVLERPYVLLGPSAIHLVSGSSSWIAPSDGGIQWSSSSLLGLIGTGYSMYVNDTLVQPSNTALITVGGPSSDTFYVSSGDKISGFTGIDTATFYPRAQ